ncbi:MAG: hypothetical protein JWN37_336 [Candidatus Nomurabacteria bacterium]|nr:hypothetical protein [Candidatus Nomurabacteria bacterium]
MDYSRKYAEVMKKMWSNPYNDQRPCVLSWLNKYCKEFQTVLDIGPGDAYYLQQIKPKRYWIFEPNDILAEITKKKVESLGIEFKRFKTIKEALDPENLSQVDAVLMLHVLLYMEIYQIEVVLNTAKDKKIIMVNPSPGGAVTIKFEESMGNFRSQERIRLKEAILGNARYHEIAKTHFRLTPEIPLGDLSFLIAQLSINASITDTHVVIIKANNFIKEHIKEWKKKNYIELPQEQVLELFN